MDKSFSWALFNEAYHTSECWFIRRISFFFSLWVSALHDFWNLGFFHIPNYVLGFSTNKRQLLVCLHPLTTTWLLIMRLHPVMNERQLSFCSLKIHPMLIFLGGVFLGTNNGWRFASPLTHIWLIESEALPRLSHLVIIERMKERWPLPLPLFCNSCLLLSPADSCLLP